MAAISIWETSAMAAISIWETSAFYNQPESVYDAFLRNPRDKDGRLMLPNRNPEWQSSPDAVAFAHTFGESSGGR